MVGIQARYIYIRAGVRLDWVRSTTALKIESETHTSIALKPGLRVSLVLHVQYGVARPRGND